MSPAPKVKSVRDIITQHPQSNFGSCVAWATEVVLLAYGKNLPSPRLQELQLSGFGESKAALKKENIGSTQDEFKRDFGRLERESKTAISKGSIPIVMFPSYLFYHPVTRKMDMMTHAYVIFEESSSLIFGTRILGASAPLFISRDDFENMRLHWTAAIDALDKGGTRMDHLSLMHTLFPIVDHE